MDFIHKLVSPGLIYAAAGVNIFAGISIFAQPFHAEDVKARLKAITGDDAKAAEALAVFKPAEISVRGKGVALALLGSLLLCGLRTGNRQLLNTVIAAIAVGDAVLLAQWFAEYRKDKSFGAKCPFMGWSAFELLAFGSYLASCRKPFSAKA